MKSLETYESFKYKLLNNKYAYGTIKAECDKTGKSPEEIIHNKYKRYAERHLSLSKIELKQMQQTAKKV